MNKKRGKGLTIRELVLFAMFGALMFCSKLVMEAIPNVHLLGTLTIAFTIVYRVKALIPIYVYVALVGIYGGFATWWLPHLYVWTVLWAVTMLLPRKIPRKVAFVLYPILCCVHGLLYGVMCALSESLVHSFNFEQTLAWIATGAMFDILHGIGNFAAGFLILPLSELLLKLEKSSC